MAAQTGRLDCALFDISDRAKFRARGSDRVRFFNGQLTNDVRKASESAGVEAAVLNSKGKMEGHLFLHAEADCFLIDTEKGLHQTLPARLERYIIADDVEIEDVTDQFSIFHVLTSDIPKIDRCRTVGTRRFNETGFDLWAEASVHDDLLRELSTKFVFCDADRAETLRIEEGIPKWGSELTTEVIPVEANLEERCIDYEKGCYIGQETISRMKMSGQRSKRLCGLKSPTKSALSPGMRLISSGGDNKEVGWITSVAWSEPVGAEIALAYVKRGFNVVGTTLQATSPAGGTATAEVEVVDLPFVGK